MKRMNKIDLINQFFIGKIYDEDTKTQLIRILSEKRNDRDLTSIINILKQSDKLTPQQVAQLLNESIYKPQVQKRMQVSE